MSVEIPKMTIAFGSYGIPQADVIECRVHLGCTKEVSSFDLQLQNWNGKYSPSGSIPLAVGMDGSISIGRGNNAPQIITCRIESIKHESTPTEHYTKVSGRCWGERLFRRVFTGTFANMKGEEIVKHLLDYYAGLSHVRGGTELVENTDTTYTWLEYENTPVWDILKYIAESSDKQGVIGFDFRVAPDGKFEFFPRNSKTSAVSLTDKIEVSEYRKDIHRIRNKIFVLGANEKKIPTDTNEDGFTESLTNWSLYYTDQGLTLSSDHVSGDGQAKYSDSYSVEAFPASTTQKAKTGMYRIIDTIKCRGPDGFKQLRFWLKWERDGDGDPTTVKVRLETNVSSYYYKEIVGLVGKKGEWKKIVLNLEEYWALVGNPDWSNINRIGFIIEFSSDCYPRLYVDHIVFEDCRFSAKQEDTASQNAYGLRELTETDEELFSDNECLLRAKALLAHLKDPVECLTIKSTVIDYGTTPLLPGDKIHVTLPNENVNADYRIISVEYYVDAKTQTLEITLELGKEIPLLADYLYGLRSTTVTVEKLARTKLGKGSIPPIVRAPTGHDHSGETIRPNAVNCNTVNAAAKITGNAFSDLFPETSNTGAVGTTSKYWNCIAGNGVWYKALGQFDALDDLALIKRIRGNGKVDEKGMPLVDPESLPEQVRENGLINAGALMGLLIGAVKQLAAKVELLEKKVTG